MLKVSASAIAGAAVLGPNAFAQTDSAEMTVSRKVLVIGGHPDDPETACGGTMAILKDKGYDVVAVYLTRGGNPESRARLMRKRPLYEPKRQKMPAEFSVYVLFS